MEIQIQYYTQPWVKLKYDAFTFSGGEEHIRLGVEGLDRTAIHRIMITTRLCSSAAIMQLVMATDALRQYFDPRTRLELKCGYFPYARQDRVCNVGEAFSAKVMAQLINHLRFRQVYLLDPHSKVVSKYLKRCVVLSADLLPVLHWVPGLRQNDIVVAPDKGARDKAEAMRKALEIPELIQADKIRDPATGRILATYLEGDVAGKAVLIPDDICDGGRTFIELAKALRKKGAGPITLFVTHGIFSKGFKVFEGYIDEIITTDSVRTKVEQHTLNDSEIPLHIMELL